MSNKFFITEEELIRERTSPELICWVDKKIQKISQQEGGKEALRIRKGLCKVFMEEIYPLRILAELQFNARNDVKFQPVVGTQNYDALVTDYSFSPAYRNKLEITQAHEGENEFLRHLMLQQEGWCPLTGKIQKIGTKNTGRKLEAKLVARPVQDSLNHQIELTYQALNRKLEKDYEDNTSLLIVFDDIIASHIEESGEVFQDFFQDKWKKVQKFSTLYIAGLSQRIFLKFS